MTTRSPHAPLHRLYHRCSGILLPTTVPPTFTRLSGVNVSVDEARGTFALQLSAELDRPGQVYFTLYRWAGRVGRCTSGDACAWLSPLPNGNPPNRERALLHGPNRHVHSATCAFHMCIPPQSCD